MEQNDLTVEILKSIREGIAGTNTRLDQMGKDLGARIDQVGKELGARIGDLADRMTESEVRTATAITALAGTMEDMTHVLRAANELRPRVERCEREIEEIKRSIAAEH